ncbi:MAG: insulinase family protein [Treponema sp.]|nr:insulinase family protein [Treponema sp.]
MIKKNSFSNNVVLITESMPYSKTVSVGFYFLGAGSRYETSCNRGASHFCEHMLFKGTKDLSTHDIALVFDRMGGYVNAFTERDNVCAYCTVPALNDNLSRAVRIFCAMASECVFPADELERERTVIQNEISSAEDDAEESAMDAAASLMWPGQSLGMTITGSVRDVENLSRGTLTGWYNDKFVRGELAVVVCGALSDADEAMLMGALSSLPERAAPVPYPHAMRSATRAEWKPAERFMTDRRFSQCQIYTLYPFRVPVSHDELSALCVLNAVAGDTMSSRLFENIREKNGACYSTYCFSSCYEDTAFWGAAAVCDRKNVVKIARLLQDEVSGLLTNPPTDQEILNAREHILGEEHIAGGDSEALMKRNARHYAMGLPLIGSDQVCDSIRTVQKNAIMDFIESMIVNEKRVFFIYGADVSHKQRKEILCRTR